MEGLKASEQEAQQIVDAIPQTIAVLSPDGRALYGNRSLLQYIGLTIDEMTSTDFRARGATMANTGGFEEIVGSSASICDSMVPTSCSHRRLRRLCVCSCSVN